MIPLIGSTKNRQIHKPKIQQRLPEAEWGRNEELLFFNEYRVSVWNDYKVLEMGGNDGCTSI